MDFITTHHTQGILFYETIRKRRYAVQDERITIDGTDGSREVLDAPTAFYGLTVDDSEYFQYNTIRDDIDELIYISHQYIDGVKIANYQIISNSPRVLTLRFNGSLELSIDRDEGIVAMAGLPNEKALRRAWVKGTVMDIGTVLEIIGVNTSTLITK
ncbi:hypothetical protein [Enterobacter asburiae]